ncbi:phosphatase PAP2 family protein [Hymenobacter rubripertinctus]|uniref:Phosphatase PAP2 family protein n=1 Tax=Hymenobacter rubripertinctus TaxID=2029981 RepID=A0A418R2Y8_9BACT|nr:phosphatase PAP2 family protein [Hymenobacter rubripertinctus]RIY11759.1 phosphatase PAP2 family protein [Hymenobacter rubripertinctus]
MKLTGSPLFGCLLLAFLLPGRPGCAQVLAPTDSVRRPEPARPWRRRPAVLRTAIPLTLVTLGYFSRNENMLDEFKEELREETREHFPQFSTTLDDYSRHAPIWMAYGLYAGGMKGERGVVPFSICYGLSHALSTGLVSNLKRISHTRRPDVATDFSSFPSAHTAEAFMTATLLHEQFGKDRPWVSVAGYTVATATGAMRMLNDRHWVTDVVAGASIGFLSAEAVWRLYPAVARLLPARLGQKLLLLPTYAPGGTVGAVLVVR